MILVHARIPIDPDDRRETLDAIERLATRSRAEDGTVDYRATTEVGDPDVVHFFEQYEDWDAREAHGETDHYERFEATLPEIADGEITVSEFEVEGEPRRARFGVDALEDA